MMWFAEQGTAATDCVGFESPKEGGHVAVGRLANTKVWTAETSESDSKLPR